MVHQEFSGDGSEDLQAEMNFVNGYGNYQNGWFNQNYKNHPNLSYRSTNVENPQDQVYPTQAGSQGQKFQPNGFQNKGTIMDNSNLQQVPVMRLHLEIMR